jgi:hypothetical protein
LQSKKYGEISAKAKRLLTDPPVEISPSAEGREADPPILFKAKVFARPYRKPFGFW